MRKTLEASESLKAAIRASGKSAYQLCKEADVHQATMSRFLNGGGWLARDSFDRLMSVLNLEISEKGRLQK